MDKMSNLTISDLALSEGDIEWAQQLADIANDTLVADKLKEVHDFIHNTKDVKSVEFHRVIKGFRFFIQKYKDKFTNEQLRQADSLIDDMMDLWKKLYSA